MNSKGKLAFSNPFTLNRAEQMGDSLHEYFVADGLEGLLCNKPLVLEGGRGCGKTMFLRYHSYTSKKREYIDRGMGLKEFLEQEQIIGLYYKAESSFVTAFQHRGLPESEWTSIFAHFMTLQVASGILGVLLDLKTTLGFELQDEAAIYQSISTYISGETTDKGLCGASEIVHKEKAAVVKYLNNVGRVEAPLTLPLGVLTQDLVQAVCREPSLSSRVFHVFVDEFENLLDYQQVVINTLIKGSAPPLVYDIGVRKKGRRKRETLASSEIIGEPHDYARFDLEAFIGQSLEELLQKVCFKRLRQHPDLKKRGDDDPWLSIKSYLGQSDMDKEFTSLFPGTSNPEFLQRLSTRISTLVPTGDALCEAQARLADPTRLAVSRLNLCLLERHKPQKVGELLEELEKYDSNKPSKYTEWLHNNKMGLLFLLYHEVGRRKTYYGFDVFCALSSGIVRYFLELCEHAFENAAQNGFSYQEPRQLDVEEQDAAAHHVSRYKFNDIETYPPNGPQLKRLVLLLGGIFGALHRDPALSEPERNHFFTHMDQIGANTKQILDSAVMWTVLQEKSPTKEKEPFLSYEEVDYHLNRIYAPRFQISHRQIRKLYIPPDTLNRMVEQPLGDGRKAARALLTRHKLVEPEPEITQLELWSI